MATVLINGADPSKYGSLVADLCNQFVKGKDEYPQTLADAVSMLELYTPLTNHSHGSRSGASGGSVQSAQSRGASAPEPSATTFVQQGNGAMSYQQRVAASVAGTDGVLHAGISCFGCGGYGHYSDMCTGAPNNTPTTTGTTLTQYAFMLAQSCDMGIDPDSILLDSQSTISVFRNPRMLTNIRRSKHTLRAITNGGYQDSNLVGDFANLGEVWFNENTIANILSLADECNVCRVTMDSGIERSMNVHRLDGSIMQFVEHESGLYVYHPNVTNPPVTGYSMLSTVAAQKKLFTPRQIRDADTARNLYRMIGRPSAAEFQTILRRGYIRNCPVTPADARRADIIYGPDIATIKGKCKRREAAARVPTFEAVPIPPPVLAHHLDITLCLDFFFVQGLGFYHSISRNVGFRTVKPIADRTKGAIVSSAKADIALYAARGFHVRDAHADHEFECARDALRPVVLNIVPPDSHVGEVERSIQTIKERLRSPESLVTGRPNPDYNHIKLEFGTYVQVFEDNDPSNTPKARSLGAIALDPTGNAQGDYNFLSLATGARISRHQWIALPMTDTAIARVEALGVADEQPLIQEQGLVFVPIDADEPADLLADNAAHQFAPPAAPDALDQGAHEDGQPHNVDGNHDDDEIDTTDDEDEEDDDKDDGENDDENMNNDDDDNEGHPARIEEDDEDDSPNDDSDDNGTNEDDDNDEGARDTGTAEQPQPRYNLRERTGATNKFKDAMYNPHDGKSYFPPTQLTQKGYSGHHKTHLREGNDTDDSQERHKKVRTGSRGRTSAGILTNGEPQRV